MLKKFGIAHRVRDALTRRGGDRWNGHIQSQMIVNGMDPSQPFDVIDDEESQQTVISQSVQEEPADEED